jgi:putative colanic acid biosynthesis acetyltransferase WcaF
MSNGVRDAAGITLSDRRLAAFDPGDDFDSRTLIWRVGWFVVQNLLFDRWWLSARLRPPLLRAFGAKVGKNCLIRHGVRIHFPWNLDIGDDTWIGEFVWLHSFVDIVIEDNVCISQRASIVTGSHDHMDPTFSYDNRPIRLQSGSWVAVGATVLRGVTVGRNSVVGARAVVWRDIPDATIVTVPEPRQRPLG